MPLVPGIVDNYVIPDDNRDRYYDSNYANRNLWYHSSKSYIFGDHSLAPVTYQFLRQRNPTSADLGSEPKLVRFLFTDNINDVFRTYAEAHTTDEETLRRRLEGVRISGPVKNSEVLY